MIIKNESDFKQALEFISSNEILSYDIESDGLNVRNNTIVGIGFSNAEQGFYLPANNKNQCIVLLKLIAEKRIVTWNAAFDIPITQSNFGIDLLPALYADAMLMKHTTDEEGSFKLKDCASVEFGVDAKKEQEEMKASVKANGGSINEFYKADLDILAKYCIQDCILTFKLYLLYGKRLEEQGLSKFFYEDEVMPLYKLVTIPMENKGICVDISKLQKAQADITKDIAQLEDDIQLQIAPYLAKFQTWFLNKDYPIKTLTGLTPRWVDKYDSQYDAWAAAATGYMFNLKSKVHLKKLFFDELKCIPLSKTPNGLPQVDDDFIVSVSDKYTWAKQLTTYNKLNKIKSTYIDTFLEEQEHGIIYPSFMQHRTVSGRYSGNMQQLPRPIPGDDIVSVYTSLIRSFIVASPESSLVSADYEQLEPTIFAHVSGDKALQDIFNSGYDFYSEVAIRTEGLIGVSSNKKLSNYLGTVNKGARQKAKAYSLGIAYGMTSYKLKFEIGCSPEVAEQLVQDYYKAFPQLKQFMDQSVRDAENLGYVTTQTGRVRHLEPVKQIFEKYGPAIRNDLELWKIYNNTSVYAQAKEDRKVYKNGVNNAVNFQIQGLAASIVNQSAIKLAQLGYIPVLQIHDELVYDIPNSQLENVMPIIKKTMEGIMKLSVPLKTEPQAGTSYDKCK